MKMITIAVACVAAGALAYVSFGGDDKESPPSSTKGERASAGGKPGAASEAMPVMPRRMRAPVRATANSERMAQGQELSERLDRRRDRRAIRAERFSKYDADGDGELSDDEREALREGRRSERIARQLEAFDSNGDGALDDDELAMQAQARSEMRAERLTRILGEADSDADGMISRSEAESGGRGMQRVLRDFDDVDQDGDGLVSSEELQSAMSSRRGGPRRRLERNARSPDDAP